jgi:hypothetical protein
MAPACADGQNHSHQSHAYVGTAVGRAVVGAAVGGRVGDALGTAVGAAVAMHTPPAISS